VFRCFYFQLSTLTLSDPVVLMCNNLFDFYKYYILTAEGIVCFVWLSEQTGFSSARH